MISDVDSISLMIGRLRTLLIRPDFPAGNDSGASKQEHKIKLSEKQNAISGRHVFDLRIWIPRLVLPAFR